MRDVSREMYSPRSLGMSGIGSLRRLSGGRVRLVGEEGVFVCCVSVGIGGGWSLLG